jgi:hypothetical protein
MLGSANLVQSISGSNTNVLARLSLISCLRPLLIVRRIGLVQCAHSVSIFTDSRFFRKRPSTKGAAIASSAQAPYIRSPVLKIRRWGVSSTVTG